MAQSHISESLCPTSVSAVSAARPFCVVCGHCTGNLVPRRSGFKCPTCVGKKGNKQWTRLQRKQAAQLYTDLMQQQQEQPAGLFISQPSYDSTLSPTESSTTRDTKSTKDAMLINEYLDQAAVYKGDAVTDENFSSPSSPAPVAALNSVSSSATPPAAPLVTEKPRLPARNGKKVAAPPPPARVPRRHSDITGAPRTPRSRLSGSSNTLPLTATDSEIVIPSREASRHTADAGFVIRVDDTKTPEEEPLGDTRRTSCSTGSPEAKKHSKNRRRDSLEDSRSPSTALNQTQPDGDPYDHMPEIRGNAVEFSGDSSCCDSSQCSSDSKEVDDERPYHIPSADDPSTHEEEEDDKRSVASFDLAHISIRIKHVSAEDAEKAAGKKAGSKKSATSGGGHPLAFKKGELNQSLSQSRGSSHARESSAPRAQVERKGKFTVTRQVPQHERSVSGVSLVSNGNGSNESSTTVRLTNQRVEVKKICFDFQIFDAETGRKIQVVRRRYFADIIPLCETLKRKEEKTLPPIPSSRVPSLRFATETFLEERRTECQLFFDHLTLHLNLLCHPKTIAFLKLERCMEGPPPTKGAGGKDHTEGTTAIVPILNSKALDTLREGKGAPADGFYRTDSFTSQQSTRSSIQRRSRLDKVTQEDLEQVQLGNTIGRGSFGVVKQGLLQTSSGPLVVAVKVMQVAEDVDNDTLGTAQEELDILCAATHKNIIRYLGSIYYPDPRRELHIFTEYVECGTIRGMVDRFGCLPLLAIQKYLQQILRGLSHLHSLNIVHRDIKGENILVTKNGKVKLTDFGCSGVIIDINAESVGKPKEGEAPSTTSAPSAGPVGSPVWMSPEIIHGSPPGKPADVWALGCVGIEMLDREVWQFGNTARGAGNPFLFMFKIGKAGTPPHGFPSEEEMEILNSRPYKEEELRGFRLYRDFLSKCFQLNPDARWTADQLLKHAFLAEVFPKYLRWLPLDPLEDSAH